VRGARPGLAFDQQTFALAAGADLRWGGRPDLPALTVGIFADTARSAKDFPGDADGRATTFGAGLYALYQRPGAWHASATVRAEETDHTLNVRDAGLSADYSSRSVGAALQFGWFLPGLSPAGWWAGPSAGIGVASIGGASYDTRSAAAGNRFRVSQDSAIAAHARAQVTLGRDFAGQWGFRARFAVSHLGISGGDISCDDVKGANYLLDGFRAEGTLGLVRRLGPGGRLWLDCGTAHAAHYKRPYAISLGFSKAW
jgi:outer membrane autotransporter protein